jgi:hypothetical protein
LLPFASTELYQTARSRTREEEEAEESSLQALSIIASLVSIRHSFFVAALYLSHKQFEEIIAAATTTSSSCFPRIFLRCYCFVATMIMI